MEELFKRFMEAFPKEEISKELGSMCLAMAWRIARHVDPGMTRKQWMDRCESMWSGMPPISQIVRDAPLLGESAVDFAQRTGLTPAMYVRITKAINDGDLFRRKPS